MKTSSILTTGSSKDYELLDSGEGEKLERWGKFALSRPDPQALWRKRLPESEWKKADGYFIRDPNNGSWSLGREIPPRWQISFADLTFWIKPTAFKHTGLFPEQAGNWEWMREIIKSSAASAWRSHPDVTSGLAERKGRGEIEILNLFGYTGGATLACAQVGAKVTHIDSSKAAVTWAKENAELSGLGAKPIRWIVEDARLFVEREIRRGHRYDGLIMDPPAFGHGPGSELWKIEDDFLSLVDNCTGLLKDKPAFFLVNGYAAGYSAIAYENCLLPLIEKFGGQTEVGELTIQESPCGSNGGNEPQRLLPCGIFARWAT